MEAPSNQYDTQQHRGAGCEGRDEQEYATELCDWE